MKIYTRTGDGGTTGLLGGSRVPKNSARMQAIGDVDELGAAIGCTLCVASQGDGASLGDVHGSGLFSFSEPSSGKAAIKPSGSLSRELASFQNLLFDLGAELASPTDGRIQSRTLTMAHSDTLEESMDRMAESLPPLKQFILPGGTELASRLHLARAVCRRAERSVLELHQHEPQRAELLVFLNRLSDWMFLAARTANASQGVLDIAWQKSEEI